MNVIRPNSLQARDIAVAIHPQTNLAKHEQDGPTVIVRGDGIRIYDDSGKEFIEGAAGLWCAALGFASDRLADVAARQMRTLGYYHSYRSTAHPAGIELAEKLIELAPVPMSKVLLQCSGSEANDTAIKLCWYYQAAMGRPEKNKIIGRMGGYHGTTVAAGSLSGKPDMHVDFNLPLPQFRHTLNPHYYRFHEDGETEEEFSTRMADALEAMILEEGPDTVAAFFAEPVMGAGGVIVPPATYFEKIQAVLKKYDVLFIADEVICGFGRTGSYWGSQTFNIQPDILVCAKALSSSYLPISAVMVNEAVFQGIAEGSSAVGTWGHGFTYSGHPVAAAVAIETLKIYDETNIVAHVAEVGTHMQAELRRRFTDHPLVGEVRGVGLIGAIELSSDKAARKPIDPVKKAGARLCKLGEEHGVILRAMTNDSMGFSPPLVITKDEVTEMLDRVGKALDALAVDLRRESMAAV